MPSRNRYRETQRRIAREQRRRAETRGWTPLSDRVPTPDEVWDWEQRPTPHRPDDECYFGCDHYLYAQIVRELVAYRNSESFGE